MPVQNTAIIILGASGDLSERKLIPALERMYRRSEIDASCAIIGAGRSELSDEDFRKKVTQYDKFASLLHFHSGYEGLKDYADSLGQWDQCILFFALPPHISGKLVPVLSDQGFGENCRLIVEKPFGYDKKSFCDLNNLFLNYYDETQIYRIDHYLAKEAVQNILVFRFANSLFYPVWNNRNIESIQINSVEEEGVGTRAGYFDSAGIIRDMVQNHLFQLLALITMEAPLSLSAADIREQKEILLKSLEIKSIKRGQYIGYRDEAGIPADSDTETFVEMELAINSFRWAGVPVYIRAGKSMPRKGTEIGVRFKPVPRLLFRPEKELEANKIIFKIQPGTGIIIDHSTKLPGTDFSVTAREMDFCYAGNFDGIVTEAYQRLLLDALKGDRTLFVGTKELELAWKLIDPYLEQGELFFYQSNTLPETQLDIDWIDMERYASSCSD